MKAALAAAVLLALAPLAAPGADDSLTTTAERSKFRSTGRYPEVLQLCAAFEKAYPRFVRCVTFGRTPEGRPMVALIASRSG
ncbi:MAG TPA: M14 family zinc carboxypeptidase, partial [Usitatibacter sp.]|nr:M14 family zinc carboxypeptidase [Usitatibacter sp.]